MGTNNFLWGHNRRYNDLSNYFRKTFSGRVQKVSIDAGFTCPNRDGSKGWGGCTYCNNKTFKPTYCNLENSVTKQIDKGIAFFTKKYPSMSYLAYFQAYTSTYAPFEILKDLYEEALSYPGIVGLVISTRPDAVNDQLLDYLAEVSNKVYVMVEFGLESHLDTTLKRINRGHSFADSAAALEATARRGIRNAAHLILGLPGETHAEWLEQAKVISKLPVNNLKLHQLQIHKGTAMEKQYRENPQLFSLFTADDYVELVVDYLELLNPKIVVERFISQAPPELLIMPRWGLKNFEFVAKVDKRLKERDTWQGRLFAST
ncbi:MAG: TIGR01212 family radical SAM protein [Draconibacterium sp.]|nr:MAG: TIGR01212 family radical SAM protein [Draconibacterium sp.]PIF05574.1 MAG: TIGR01212 family radical SAM protein [Draconibacterium sp.]